jgi:predicted  nucleic acid-binding Zn-ribbon protein
MKHIIPSLLLLLACNACGTNLFQAVADPEPADEATAAMDERKSDKAIAILEKALQKEPENWLYISLLASAKAQKAGVDTTDIALGMAKAGEISGNPLTALFIVLPTPTDELIDLLAESTALLASIPLDQLEEGDTFKISMFNTALTALQAKYFDADGSGSFSVEELQNLDERAVINILNSLLNAESAASIYQSSGGTGSATGNVSQIRSQIDAQAGETLTEKLRNYLGSGS